MPEQGAKFSHGHHGILPGVSCLPTTAEDDAFHAALSGVSRWISPDSLGCQWSQQKMGL